MRNSIRKELSVSDYYSDLKMTRQVEKGVFLIVEGETDEKFFKSRCTTETLIIAVEEKDKVLELIQILNSDSKMQGYLGIVDKDFWGIVGSAASFDNLIIPTDYNDLENMLFTEHNVHKVMVENANREKVASLRFDLRERVFDEAHKIANIRLYNENIYKLYNTFPEARANQLSLSSISITDFIDPDSLIIDEEKIINRLISANLSASLNSNDIKQKISIMKNNYPDKHTVCNGHDLISIFSIAFKNIIATYDQLYRSRVESWLRLAFDSFEFSQTDLFKKIRIWEKNNQKVILSIPA